ncbi:MAG: glycosyltransferase family 4 protein [Patescibacteria group bacterium]
MKNIAIIHYTAPPIVAGVELVIKDQTTLMAENNYNVKIIAGKGKKFNPNIEVKIIPEIDPRNKDYLKMRKIFDQGQVPDKLDKYTNQIYRKLESNLKKIDVLIIHQALTMHFNFALTLALIKFIKNHNKIKIIHWTHDATFLDQNYLKLYSAFKNKFPWNLLIRPIPQIKYVSISEDRRNKIAKLFNINPSKIEIVENSLFISNFWQLSPQIKSLISELNLFEKDLVALLPMRIVRRKNIGQAIEISNELRKKLDFILLVTAPIDYQNPDAAAYFENLKKQIKKLKLDSNIIFLSQYILKNDKKFDIINLNLKELFIISDFLFVASKLEGFGMPLIEAAAMKTPIVCSKIPPFLKITDNNACLFDFEEPARKTAQKIIKFLEKNSSARLYRKVLKKYILEKNFKEKIEPLI